MRNSLPYRLVVVLARFAALAVLIDAFSCTDEPVVPAAPSSDIERLSRLINLPENPRAALFLVGPMGTGGGFIGPTDYGLLALLQYDRDSIERLKARGRRLQPKVRSIRLRERLAWFPEPLFSVVKRCSSGWCIDGERYSGDAFLKDGYVDASFIVPDNSEWLIVYAGT